MGLHCGYPLFLILQLLYNLLLLPFLMKDLFPFIPSLSAIATKRPVFYGRIMPVLLSLNPSSSDGNEKHVSGVYHTLKTAFLSCLNCTHPGAAPVISFIFFK